MENSTLQNITLRKTQHNLDPIYIAEMALTCVALLVNIPLITFILYHVKLRRIKSHQIFLNILMIHNIHSLCFLPARLDARSFYFYVYAIISQGLVIELFISMMALTIERLLAVKYPLANTNMKGRYVFFALGGSWLLPVIFVTLALYYQMTRLQYIVLGTVLLPITGVTLGCANIAIYCLIKKHEAFVRNNGHQRSDSTKRRSLLKPSFICFALVVSFILLWLPYLIRQLLLLLRVYDPMIHGNGFSDIAVFIGHSNSLIDPLTFIYLSSPLKRLVKLIFTKKSARTFSSSTVIETGL